MKDKVTEEQVQQFIDSQIGLWELENSGLKLRRRFESYEAGVEFAVKVAKLADKVNHHPDITILYKAVEIYLISHDINSLSNRDLELARQINEFD